jgi:hypothetical protein
MTINSKVAAERVLAGRPLTMAHFLELWWDERAVRHEAQHGDRFELTARMHSECFKHGGNVRDSGDFGVRYAFRDGSVLQVGRGQAVELTG